MVEKAKRINQLKAGAVLSYISMGLGYIISIIYTPIMLRLLGQSEYGLYNLVASVVSYLGLLSFGFGSSYMRFYSRYKVKENQENVAKLNGMYLIVFSIIAIIAVLSGVVLIDNITLIFGEELTASEISTSKILMAIMVFNIAISFPFSVFSSYITANEKYIFQKILQMGKTIINPFFMLPVLLLGYKSIGMVVVTTLLTIVVEISNIIFCLSKLKMKFIFNKFDFGLMKEIVEFSLYILINMVIDQINWNLDKFIIGRFRGTIGVAIYGIAGQLNSYYQSFSTAISNVFIPRINRMVVLSDNNDELDKLFARIGRVQFIVLSMICFGFIFFGQPFINMWAGVEYNDSYQILLLLAVPGTIPLIQNIGIEIQKAKNMHRFRSWIYLLIAIFNVLLSIPLTRCYGGVGAAIGTALSLIIGNIFVMNWYYHYRIGLNIKYFWSQIISLSKGLIIPIFVGLLISRFINLYRISIFLGCASLYFIVFCLSMWYFGMNNYEKELIRKPFVKMFMIFT